MLKIWIFLFGLVFALDASAIGMTVAMAITGATLATAGIGTLAIAFAINMVVSAVISKAFFSPNQPSYNPAASAPDPGNRQQLPPATDNKLPVVYGTAYVGGMVVDLSISENNQDIYYVIALCEVTNSNEGQNPDPIAFGKIYWGGKRVEFQANGYTVAQLVDESTGIADTNVAGRMDFYLYRNGSQTPTNSDLFATTVMSASNLVYKWNSAKKMSNCAFAIVHLRYSQSANIRGLEQTRFEIINSRQTTGDCFLDYMTNTRYGAALPLEQIDQSSLTALSLYSNAFVAYTTYTGTTAYFERYRFDGVIDTNRTIMQNLQDMASCADCLLRYNEVTAQWGVIVQQPSYTVAMHIDDSNIISAIQITPIDIASTFNVVEVKFPDGTMQDSFASAQFDLAQIEPSLLFPNEPINKQSVSLPLVNSDVRAQYIANKMLKSAREDLQVSLAVGFVGIQLQAGDVVTITNTNYGWTNKLFRAMKVEETFQEDGAIVVNLQLCEFNPSVYDDASVTQFTPAPNTGIGDPTFFGTVPAPVLGSTYPNNAVPFFNMDATTSSSGITQYLELWYSAFQYPTSTQMILIGTSEVQASGNPYDVSTAVPPIQVAGIPAGDWYFFTRMVNSLASSIYSPASAKVTWRPRTFQYTEQYLAVAYGTSVAGAGFSLSPTNKTYFGLRNQANQAVSTAPSDYTWYLADPNFGTTVFLCYAGRGGRQMSFGTGFAALAGGSGTFVPTQATIFDPSLWSALPDGDNIIDLDHRTGQLIETGTTTVGTGEIAVANTSDGRLVASLQQFLDFGPGVYQYTGSAATLTIDIYGRVVGFAAPDDFYYTKDQFTATSGQTVFTPTARQAGFITGQDWVFKNGLLLKPTTDYTQTSTTVTLTTGATLNDIVSIVSFRSVHTGTAYASFTRNYVTLTSASSYDASAIGLVSGYELLFLNGAAWTDQDYDIVGQVITNFPSTVTGELCIITWSPNNLGTPNGSPVNIATNTLVGQATYPFSLDTNAFNLYANGVMLKQSTDFTATTTAYTLTTVPTTTNTILQQQTFARTGAA